MAPSAASACDEGGDECEGSAVFSTLEVAVNEVTTDGVIMLRGAQADPTHVSIDQVLGQLEVIVTDETGAVLDGSVIGVPGVYAWRPNSPLVGGSTLIVNVTMTPYEPCGSPLETSATVVVAETAALGFALPELEFSTTYDVVPTETFETLPDFICCDGAYPESSLCGGYLWGPDGWCGSQRGVGVASARVDVGELDTLLASTIRLDYLVDGNVAFSVAGVDAAEEDAFISSHEASAEVQLRIVHMGTDEALDGEVFVADGGQPDALGEIDIDLTADIEANCEMPAYQCEVVDGSWDPDDCTSLDEDENETDPTTTGDTDGTAQDDSEAGGGCRVGGGPRGLMLLVGLLGLRRRHR
ncbi:MAG: hypothetical protein AAGA54_25905 [Myxococcota bacterium]